MNACVEFPVVEPAVCLTPDHVRLAVKRLLASPVFSKAPRMSDLLLFLVEKKICGKEHELTEYAIGLHVFRRDARVYDTVLDPVVRVQVGRLRDRLSAYYAEADAANEMRISVPAGSYVPVLSKAPAGTRALLPRLLELTPLRDLTGAAAGAMFAAGVDEELHASLFRVFGELMRVRHPRVDAWANEDAGVQAICRIEGSLRVEKNHVRVSMRLVDILTGRIEWLSQFDFHEELGIRLQEELAHAVCERLQRHLVI